jgi:SAM-dependent methyltransferase
MISGLDKENMEFWNELCGSTFAQYVGIRDHGEESLNRFDSAYLGLYPYLLKRVKLQEMAGKRVIEVGLGYGTLGQKIAEADAEYIGMDIAFMPVKMMKHRMVLRGLPGKAIQGSMLACPFENETFDCLVSIGCFHHTGDVKRCIDETHRILKPGGTAFIMVYNRFSYRQWLRWPCSTSSALCRDAELFKKAEVCSSENQRKAYDANRDGTVAPATDFLSIGQLRGMLSRYSQVSFQKENCTDLEISRLRFRPRSILLLTLGKVLGLDIYIQARK